MANFGAKEKAIQDYFQINKQVSFKGELFHISKVGKPTCAQGEPKTDIYILLVNSHNKVEIKISYKKENADFLENKIKAERAEQLFGKQWEDIIQKSTTQIKQHFLDRVLIYTNKMNRTQKGSITLGWKFELVNKSSGDLSGELVLTESQLIDVYAGNNLSEDKRDAFVNNEKIKNSGVANYILVGDDFDSAETVLEKIIEIEKYVQENPKIYFACKALNYRTFEKKFDGNRPLAVQIDWLVIEHKLTPKFIFDCPLNWNGNDVNENLQRCLTQLNIQTTDDINEQNTDYKHVF